MSAVGESGNVSFLFVVYRVYQLLILQSLPCDLCMQNHYLWMDMFVTLRLLDNMVLLPFHFIACAHDLGAGSSNSFVPVLSNGQLLCVHSLPVHVVAFCL